MLYLSISLGLILLLVGGETLVKGSVDLARRFEVPPLIIGIVLVGLGTSVPELVTCIKAALNGVPDMAVGNVIGSNIANILLVVGVGSIFMPIVTPVKAFKRDGAALAIFTAVFVGVCFFGEISRLLGSVFLIFLATYLLFSYYSEKQQSTKIEADALIPETKEDKQSSSVLVGLMLTFGGIALTVFGADLLVDGGTQIAKKFGISDAIIGLTIVAIGTSLPELATAIIAGVRGHSDMALGNIIGSNIYNMLGILGTTAVIQPLNIPTGILHFDIWVMAAATLLMLLVPLSKQCVSRREGVMMVSCYGGYMYLLYLVTIGTVAF